MPEEYFLYFEETEWCLNAVDKGVDLIWVRSAIVYHAEGASTGASNKFRVLNDHVTYYMWRNSLWMTKKLWARWIPFVFFTKLLELGYFILKGDMNKIRVFRYAIRDYENGRMGPAPKVFK